MVFAVSTLHKKHWKWDWSIRSFLFERLEDETVAWAEKMMEHSPLALRMIKAGLNAELDGQAGIKSLPEMLPCFIT